MGNEPEVILKRLKQEDIKFLQLQFSDLLGNVKTVTLPQNRFEEAISEGAVFDGSSVAGYAQIEESDMRAFPDLDTFLVIPDGSSSMKVGRFICKIFMPSGERFQGDPRFVLERLVEGLNKDHRDFFVGPELEFFLFRRDSQGNPTNTPSDNGGYFDYTPQDRASRIRQELLSDMYELGFSPEAAHHEVAYGQQEIDMKYASAIAMADRVTVLKSLIKNTAHKYDLYATFMPKPINGVNGSGMHVHQSIMSVDEKINYFYDKSGKYGISDYGLHYLGGVLKHINESAAILASWVNSYKRLIPGYEAPVYISWANKNRSALVRIPAGEGTRKRMELRCPDPAGNPYLQFAVILAMGLSGIKNKVEPPNPIERDIFVMSKEEKADAGIQSMPESLGEALHHLRGSSLMKETLGTHIFENFITVKSREWDAFRSNVTEWELNRYLPIL